MKQTKSLSTREDLTFTLRIANPDAILKWSSGEVQKAETVNYRTGRSERSGLFDERIFGPEKDYECYCGKYRRIRYKGITCEKCGVEVTRSIVRRTRMGHIELATPVAHIWFLRGVPSRMSLLLGVPMSKLEKVVYFAGYIVTAVVDDERDRVLKELEGEYQQKFKTLETEEQRDTLQERYIATKKEIISLKKFMVLNEIEYHRFATRYSTIFEAGIGAEAVFKLFKEIDLDVLEEKVIKAREETNTKTVKLKLGKRLSLIRSLMKSHTRPEWMFIKVIPVIPPALRPMIALEGGRHATSDINDLYRRVINRNNRLKKLMGLGAPDVILRNEKRILQEAVDALMDNSIRKGSSSPAMSQSQRRSLKSLADHLKGKAGIFRQNLLGKRVDYSGRSVIIVGPNLKLNECGLPKYMALELFRPFVVGEIIKRELAFNIRGAGRLIEEADTEVWSILEDVIKGKYVLLNRAPTLHRLSIQAFHPKLIEGKAIQVHPLVCSAFNADFDGDQMAVHLPLSEAAQKEADQLMSASKNLLKPQMGDATTTPSQDMVLGCYWMTLDVPGEAGEGKIFSSPNEAISAYDYGAVGFRSKILVLGTSTEKYTEFNGRPFETTVGRLLFNSILPEGFPYQNKALGKKDLGEIVNNVIEHMGLDHAPAVLDAIKAFGFKYVTISGSTFGMEDAPVPEGKAALIDAGKIAVKKLVDDFEEGFISDQERYMKTIEIWEGVKKDLGVLLSSDENMKNAVSVNNMSSSGARGSKSQLMQSAGMKGVIQNAAGKLLEFPILSSYKEGLSPLEYFINTTTARKGLTDTALNTAKAGYLTRRLHDVAQDIVITEEDCATRKNITVREEVVDGIQRTLEMYAYGRILAADVFSADGTKIAGKGDMVNRQVVRDFKAANIMEAVVRTPLRCETLHGVCRRCYGLDLGRNWLVKLGSAVGTIASQAIGEPGTQLTLRTFHSGGVVGRDITQGLPRVEEIFERRNPKALAVIATENGMVSDIKETEDGEKVVVVSPGKTGDSSGAPVEYLINRKRIVLPEIKKGAEIKKGDLLTDGSANMLDLFAYAGQARTEDYLINEINKVYELHSAPVSPKHLEIIARQMFSRVKISNAGESDFTIGDVIEYIQFMQENEQLLAEGKVPMESSPVLLGISEVSLTTKSWLSSASFQHTTRVLINNAIRGRRDTLRGLKENVIVGNLIPAGTGFSSNFIDFSKPTDGSAQDLAMKAKAAQVAKEDK